MTVADVSYEITEIASGGGWQVSIGGRKRTYPTAVEAQQAVTAAERELADASGSNRVAVIGWNTVTDVGRTVVKAIT